jgi:hypothetical protein
LSSVFLVLVRFVGVGVGVGVSVGFGVVVRVVALGFPLVIRGPLADGGDVCLLGIDRYGP